MHCSSYALHRVTLRLLQKLLRFPAHRLVLVCSFLQESASGIVCLLHVAHSPTNQFRHDMEERGSSRCFLYCSYFAVE